MKICNQAILLSMIALGLGACSVETPWGNSGEGGIALKLTASADVKDAIPVVRASEVLEAPDVNNFGISLTNLSSTEVTKFNTLADFQANNSFRTGAYTVAAFYGSAEDEGFEKPYFYGETEVTVLEGRQTTAEITATLANSMISIDYTDGFKNYFPQYGVTVHSEGHSYVDFAADETRPAFICPGEVSIAVNVTNPSGKRATLQPAAFPAAAAHHYHVTFDVATGIAGQAQLKIVFDDTLETEDVSIDLTDELFTAPAPKVSPVGFEDGATIEALSGNPASVDALRFDVSARAGITQALLTISGDGFTPSFGNEIDLVKANAEQQKALSDMGINVRGLYKNPQSMAIVDVTNLPQHLPEGQFRVSLVVKDLFTRISEPLTLNITTVPVVVNANPGGAILGTNQATLQMDYNGADPEANFSFKAMANTGLYKDVKILSVAESTRTRSFDTKTYIFTISLPDTDREEIPVKVLFNGIERQEIRIPVSVPGYNLEVDAFSSFAKVKVIPENAADLAAIVNVLKFYNGSTQLSVPAANRNNESGIIVVENLNPATEYTLGHGLVGNKPDATVNFTTETAAALPNGDFAETYRPDNLFIENIEVGGAVKVFGTKTTIKSTIDRYVPSGWATVNALTCAKNVSTVNTWFCVPSTYSENGEVVIRNVGYDHNGSKPADYGGTFNTQYYNTNTPTFGEGKQAAGELFLGSYNEGENRVDGVNFESRPGSVTFDFKYAPQGDDKAIVKIELLDSSGKVIASGSSELSAQASMTSHTVALSAYAFGSRAASLRLNFKSSDAVLAPVTIPTGSALDEGVSNLLDTSKFPAANRYKAFASGSVLTIDNVKLNY